MQGTVFISQICAVAVAFNSFFFLEMVKKNDSILKRQSFFDSESIFSRLPKAFDIFIRKGQNINYLGEIC